MIDSTQLVPDDEVVLVEYPGIVRNVDAAMATLGGPAALAARQAVGAILQLRFRPGDPLSHPLIADRQPARGMLLRIACPPAGAAAPNGTPVLGSAGPSVTVTGSGEDRGADGGAAEAGALPVEAAQGTGARAHVVACVRSAYRFTGLADFQYVAHDGRPPGERVRCCCSLLAHSVQRLHRPGGLPALGTQRPAACGVGALLGAAGPRQTLALTSPRNPAEQPL